MVFVNWWCKVSHTHSVGFMSFQNTRKFCLNFVGCATPTTFHNFTMHSRSNWCFQLFTRVLDCFLEFLIFGVDEVPRNFRALSRWIFSSDQFCFSFSLAFFPIDFHNSGHRWSGLDVSCFSSISFRTKYIRQEFFHRVEEIVWNLSKDQTNLETHRYSSNHRCVSFAWHPNSYESFWIRQCILVE